MKISKLINRLQELYGEYGDMQVYAFGFRIKGPNVYINGEDDAYADFSRE